MTIEQIKKEHDYYEKLKPDMKNINYTYPDMHIIKAILELNENIKTLDAKIAHLNSKFDDWKQYVTELRDQLQ